MNALVTLRVYRDPLGEKLPSGKSQARCIFAIRANKKTKSFNHVLVKVAKVQNFKNPMSGSILLLILQIESKIIDAIYLIEM